MIGASMLSMAVILIGIMLIGYLMFRPSAIAARGGKMLVLIGFLVFPVLAGGIAASEHLEHSKRTGFCLSCHLMSDYGRSLRTDDKRNLPALHYRNNLVPRDQACYACHTDYAVFGKIDAQLRGLKYAYAQYRGEPSPQIKLYQPFHNRQCLRCHLGANSFEEGAAHLRDPQMLPMMKAGQLSCSSTGCHDVGHHLELIKDPIIRKGTTNEATIDQAQR